MRDTGKNLIAAFLGVLLLVATSRGEDVLAAAARVPADVDVLVVVDDARSLRDSALGEALLTLGGASGGFVRSQEAWERLSAKLGMDAEKAFDKLLGRRVIFTARWRDGGRPSWALLSDVSRRSERRLHKALRPAPRAMEGGRPVLAVEHGAFEMIVSHSGDRSTMLLGPGDDRTVFGELARTLDSGPGAPFIDTDVARRIGQLGFPADAMLFFRSPTDREDWVALLIERGENSAKLGFLVGMPALAERAGQARPWSLETFEALADDAFAVVLDVNDPQCERERPAGQGALRLHLPPAFKSLMSDRLALVVRPGETGPIEFALAFETIDAEGMASAGDRMLAELAARVIGEERLTERIRGFEQMPTTARRTVDLGGAIPLEDFGWTAGPHASWQARIGEACNPGQHQGWWTVGVGPDTVEWLSRRLSARDDERPSMPWLSLGVIRPASTIGAMREAGMPVSPVFAPFEQVDEINWRAVEISSGLILGHGAVELRGAPRRAPVLEPAVADERRVAPGVPRR